MQETTGNILKGEKTEMDYENDFYRTVVAVQAKTGFFHCSVAQSAANCLQPVYINVACLQNIWVKNICTEPEKRIYFYLHDCTGQGDAKVGVL